VAGPAAPWLVPVITGVEFGHQERKIQFPVGCRVEFGLRGDRPVLRYLEDLVALDE
jgi:muramoyltetrapeptide carboxypeptidase LdcA involved in peptidoglycan recycling